MRMKNLLEVANGMPYATAYMDGSEKYKDIKGSIKFYPWSTGTVIKVEMVNLPNIQKNNFFGFHIHEGVKCGPPKDNFAIADGHFNPEEDAHPNHIGDMPQIYSNQGYAFMLFYTNRFKPQQVVGRTCIIHENRDDYKTQPTGDSGGRIACGQVKRPLPGLDLQKA